MHDYEKKLCLSFHEHAKEGASIGTILKGLDFREYALIRANEEDIKTVMRNVRKRLPPETAIRVRAATSYHSGLRSDGQRGRSRDSNTYGAQHQSEDLYDDSYSLLQPD